MGNEVKVRGRLRSIHIRLPQAVYQQIKIKAIRRGFRNPTRYVESMVLMDIKSEAVSISELEKLLLGDANDEKNP